MTMKISDYMKTIKNNIHPGKIFLCVATRKIENKMFSYITQNWRGVPLISHEVVVQLIGNTRTTKGLQIQAQLDYREYCKGKKVDDEDFKGIAITKNKFRGEWNYTICPVIIFEVE